MSHIYDPDNAYTSRLMMEEVMKDTEPALSVTDQLQQQLAVKQATIDELIDERNRIAYVLRTFYFAQLSLSTLQPLLALAIEMNPEIVEQRR